MEPVRIELGYRVEAIYHGRKRLSDEKTAMLPEVWLLLDDIRRGQIPVELNPGEARIFRMKLSGGNMISLFIVRPGPGEPVRNCDFCVMDLWWPEDLN